MANFDDIANLFVIENVQNQINFQPQPRIRRETFVSDAFKLSNSAFIKNYRLSKELVKDLSVELSPLISLQNRSSYLDVATKVSYLIEFPNHLHHISQLYNFFFTFGYN